MSVFSDIQGFLISYLGGTDLTAKFKQIIELALLKACEDIEAKAKAGTLPDLLKPYSAILIFLADAAEEILTPKAP